MTGVWRLVLLGFLEISFRRVSSQTTYTCSANAACGCSANAAVLNRIVGGEPAADRTWGWMASLRSSSDGSHFCGGSVISAGYILTAAHCTKDIASPTLLRVYVGSTDLTSIVQVRNVSKIYNHPSYSTTTYLNDIAILKLSSALDLGQVGADLICLPHVSASVLANGEYPAAGIDVNLSASSTDFRT